MGGCWYVCAFFLTRLGFGGKAAWGRGGGEVGGEGKGRWRVGERSGWRRGEDGKWGIGRLTFRRGGSEPRGVRMGIWQSDAEGEFP